MVEFRMPSLGADMEAGTLTEWLVKPGDQVKRGDIVAVVETQKGAIEIETFQAGTIDKFLVDVGARVPVGTPLASIRIAGEVETAPAVSPSPAKELPRRNVAPPQHVTSTPPPAAPGGPLAARGRASPAARRLAESKGINLAGVTGTGPGGVIGIVDVEALLKVASGAKATETAPARGKAIGIDLDQMRAAIAAGMARSKREIPHYYLQHTIDLSAAEAWLAAFNAERPPASRALMAALVAKAVATAVKEFPAFNGFYSDGRFEPSPAVHLGLAIAIRGGGLIAPAIHDTASLSIDKLMAAMRDLIQRSRAGRIRGSEIADPTITVSSLGERGVEALYGVIYPPQVAIVGVGKVVTRPWVIGSSVEPRRLVTLTLSADHRVSDGHAGAQFLAAIGEALQEPDKL